MVHFGVWQIILLKFMSMPVIFLVRKWAGVSPITESQDARLVKTCNLHFGKPYSKVGYVFLMVIWSEFHMGQYRDDKHREDAPHLILSKIFLDGSEITITIDQKVRLMVEVIFKVLALYLFLFAVRLLIPTFNQFLIYFILVLLESIDYRFINLRKVLF